MYFTLRCIGLLMATVGTLTISLAQVEDIPFDKRNIEDKFELRKAREAIKEGDYYLGGFRPDYDAALKAYNIAQEINPNNVELNLKIALCYLYSPTKEHMKCMVYYEKALKLDPSIKPYIVFYLGEAYHKNRQWQKGIEYYQNHLVDLEDEQEIRLAKKRIQECKNGVELSKRPVNIKTENLGDVVNSEYDEYGVVITADESAMYFTSRRENTVGRGKDSDGKYYEDVYLSYKIEGSWTNPINLGPPINSDDNDAVVSISPTGERMVLFREGDLFFCNKDEETGNWSKPKAFPKQINTRFLETSACFSVTGDTLYFVSNREDLTMGGLDIFYCINEAKEEGQEKWSEVFSLGATINTPYDEDGVFIHPEGHTLYFSSTGHNTMGGYDIFRSELEGNRWGTPENIGVPMNTPEDELYLSLSRSGRYGYYSSESKDGVRGEDIYRVTFLDIPEEPEEDQPEAKPLMLASATDDYTELLPPEINEVDLDNSAIFSGIKVFVFDEETKEPLMARVVFSAKNIDMKSNEKGVATTLIIHDEDAIDLAFEASTKGYITAKGTANLSESRVDTLEIPLKKLQAKAIVLAKAATKPAVKNDITPKVKKVTLDNALSLNPTTLTVLEKATEQPIEGATVMYNYVNEMGTKETLDLTTDEKGLAKAIVPFNDSYSFSASAAGYITKELARIEQKFSRSVYFQLEKRTAKAVVLASANPEQYLLENKPQATAIDVNDNAVLLPFLCVVVDEKTQKPILRATATLSINGKIATMATNGRGELKTIFNNTEGEVSVSVSAIGYVKQTETYPLGSGTENRIVLTPKAERIVALGTQRETAPLVANIAPPEIRDEELEIEEAYNFFATKVLDASDQTPVQGDIQIIDTDGNKALFNPKQNKKGAFLTHLPLNRNLQVVVEAEGYLYHSENFKVDVDGNYVLGKEAIFLKKVEVGESLTLNNVIFEVSSVDLQESSYAELNRLVSIMNKNPTLKVEISGHTDYTRGRNMEGLMELSLLRARSVKEYLVEQGIDESRMMEKGYGPSRPIVSNDDQELKYLNRRVEFEILSK